jgi:predicted aconitase with swiveling domain
MQFKGRPVIAGEVKGQSIVSHRGFNTLACYFTSVLTEAKQAICSDKDNPELYGKNLTDKILCIPKTIGSTSSSATWEMIARMDIAPKAILFSQPIDSLAAAGLVLARVWAGKTIVVVDRLGDFINHIETGQFIHVTKDGSVIIPDAQERESHDAA